MNSVDNGVNAAEIVHLYLDKKKSMAEIAKELSISSWNVHDKLHKAGVDVRPRMTPQCQEAARRANTGRTLS